ncbi:MAG: lmo0937 family membrane protein [Candidatus Eremiobacteraeota bacterium]|nr:lmo0937 family membrane protein [Candidatus Eremiobacteraeota bacterium]MBV8374590.1 lmo0937 family membrane protein [Candidatus Eremiobacteraeota bacterium]
MLWAIIVLLFIFWLIGFFAVHLGGGLIHLLLVVAVILLIVNLLSGRGARV